MEKEPTMLTEQMIVEAEEAIVADEALVNSIKQAATSEGLILTAEEFSKWLADL